MKLLLFLLFLVTVNYSFAQELKIMNNEFKSEKVYDIPNKSKEDIAFSLNEFHRSPKEHLTRQLKNEDNLIVFNTRRIYKEGKEDYLSVPIWITIDCYIKDEKVKIILKNFVLTPRLKKKNAMKLNSIAETLTPNMTTEEDMVKLQSFIDDIYKALEEYLYPAKDVWDF